MIGLSFSLAQIEAFASVCEKGSLSKAALALDKNRTTVSELIDTLEINLNYRLFDRSKRPLLLTREGQLLYAQARLFLQEAEAFNQIARQVPEDICHTLTLCYDCFTPVNKLYVLVNQLKQRNIKLNLLCVERSQAEQMLESGMADMGIYQSMGRMINDSFKWRVIGTIDLAIYAHQDFFGHSGTVSMMELVSSNQLMPLLTLPDYLVKRLRISDHIQTVNDLSLLKMLLNDGEGWAILPSHLLESEKSVVKKMSTVLSVGDISQTMVVLWCPTAQHVVKEVVQAIQL